MPYFRSTVWVSLVLAATSTAYLIHRYAISIPFQDDWDFVQIYTAIKTGTFGLGDLTAQHNEHRVFVPLLIMSLNAIAFGWSIKINLYFSVVIEVFTSIMLINLANNTLKNNFLKNIGSYLIILQVFNMAQFVNWLWEWDIEWHILNFGTVGVFVSLYNMANKNSNFYLIFIPISFAFIASFSLSAGFFLWPFGLIYILTEIRLRKYLSIWLISSFAAISMFFYGYHFMPRLDVSMTLTERVLGSLEFIFRFLGSTLWTGMWGGVVAVVLGAAAIIACGVQKKRSAVPWLCIAMISGIGALAAAVSRVPLLGAVEGSQTRYSTLSLLFIVSVGMLISIACEYKYWRFGGVLLISLIFVSVLHYETGYRGFFWLVDRLKQGQNCLYNDIENTPCLESIYFKGGADKIRKDWAALLADGWADRMKQR